MKKYKKIICILTVTLMSFWVLTGCSNTSNASSEKDSSSENTSSENNTDSSVIDYSGITVAGMIFQEDQHALMMQKGMEAAATDYGCNFLSGNCSQDQQKEAEYVNTYVAQGVDGIAIAPLSADGSVSALKSAANAGLKIALSDRDLSDTSFTVGGFTSNQYQLGESTGKVCKEFIESEMDGKANIAVIQYKSFHESSIPRVEGFEDQVTQLDGVKIVSDQDSWETDKAYAMVQDLLNSDLDVNLIFCNNENAVLSAAKAVIQAGRAGEVFVFGVDCSEQIASVMQENKDVLKAVTAQDPYTLGYDAMDAVIKSIAGEETGVEPGETVEIDGTLITCDDDKALQDYLDMVHSATE